MVQSYTAMGCNIHDVFFMEISDRDSDALCQTWTNNYGVEFPTISGTAGGAAINDQYGISGYPTVILIAPDHSIVIHDLWPIDNAQTIITQLEALGIQQHNCNAPLYDPQVTVIVNDVTEISANVTFIPNEDCAAYYYNVYTEAEMQAWISTMGISAGEVLQNYGFEGTEEMTHDFDGLQPGDTYFVWVVPADIDGNLYEVQQVELVATPIPPDIMQDFTGIDINGKEINLYSILDAGQTVLINLFLTDDASAQIMPYVVESYRLFGCNDHDVYFMEICPQKEDEDCRNWAEFYGVTYPTISRTGGGNDIAQSIPVAYYPTVMIINPDHSIAYRDLYPIEDTQTIVDALEGEGCEQHECTTGIEESGNSAITLYPNPASENITLKGVNLGSVSVYNALGQKVEDFNTNSYTLTINTAKYENGVYVVKTDNGTTARFVVKH